MAETATVPAPAPLPDVAPASAAAPPGGAIAPPGATLPPGDWRAGVPEELRGHPSLADVKDIGGLAKRFIDTKAMVGEAVKVPKADASPEERAAFHRKLGVPQSPDQYGETVPEQLGWPAEVVASARMEAQKLGLTPSQFQGLIDWQAKTALVQKDLTTAEQIRQDQAAQAEALTLVQREWGPKDSITWKRQVDLATRVVQHYFGGNPRMLEQLQFKANDPIDPHAVMALAKIGEATQEDIYVRGETPLMGEDKEDLTRQIREVKAEIMQTNAGSPRYQELRDRQNALEERRYRGGR